MLGSNSHYYTSPWSTSCHNDDVSSESSKSRDMNTIQEECCSIFDRKVDTYSTSENTTPLETSQSCEDVGSVLDVIGGSNEEVGNDGYGFNAVWRARSVDYDNHSSHESSCFLDDQQEKSDTEKTATSIMASDVCKVTGKNKVISVNCGLGGRSRSDVRHLTSSWHSNNVVNVQYRHKWPDFCIPDRRR